MIETLDILSVEKTLHVKVTGKLTKESYESFAPVVDQQIAEHGKIRILFEMHDFHGWTAGALWEDMKFDFKHWKDIEKLADRRRIEMGRGHVCFLQTVHVREDSVLRSREAGRG